MRSLVSLSRLAPWGVMLALATPPVFGNSVLVTGSTMTFTATGTNSLGNTISASAVFSVDQVADPGSLTLVLSNNATSPLGGMQASDLLTSFYFDVSTTGSLGYASAQGAVYQSGSTGSPQQVLYTPPLPNGPIPTYPASASTSDLRALGVNYDTWQFKSSFTLSVDSSPTLHFGVGTVGNNSLSPNGFDGPIVDGRNFGIYAGTLDNSLLQNNQLFVKDSITFKFSNFSGSITDITSHAVFGWGTEPDTIVSVPEPAGIALAAAGLLAGTVVLARRRARFRAAGAAMMP